MKREDVIKQLESLKLHCENMAYYGVFDSAVDVEALEIAIEAVKGTAQEVPVQEQYTIYINPSEVICKVIIEKMLLNQQDNNHISGQRI